MKFSTTLFAAAVFAASGWAVPLSQGREEFARRHYESLVERKAAIRRDRSLFGHHSHVALNISSHLPQTVGDVEDPELLAASAASSTSYATVYTSNWAGAVVQSPPAGETFNYVAGAWTIPTVTKPEGGEEGAYYVGEWIGIDGYSYQEAILQAGILTEVTYDGDTLTSTSVTAWYEWYPAPLQFFSFDDFDTGDLVHVSVEAITSTEGLVIVQNLSKGMQVSIGVDAPSSDNALGGQNAEWIVEDISTGTLVPFGSFSTITFNDCVANTSSVANRLDNAVVINMEQNNSVLATATITSDSQVEVYYG